MKDMYFDDEIKVLFTSLEGFKSFEELKTTINAQYEYMKKNKVEKMIADYSKSGVLSVKFQKWFKDEWFPKAINETSLKYVAIIVSQDIFVQFGVNNIKKDVMDAPIIQNFFSTMEDAKKWITSVE